MNAHIIKFYISLVICLLIFLSPILSYCGFLMPEGESIENWFSNSGALMVSLAVIGEFLIAPYNSLKLIPAMVYGQHVEVKIFVKTYASKTAAVEQYLLTSVFIGTLIWGYSKYFF